MDLRASYASSQVLAELYDMVPAYTNRPDQDLYVDYATSAPGGTLELGCGTGRILLPIAARGCRISGVDSSEHMLSQCRQKQAAMTDSAGDRVQLVQGNMIEFDLSDTFDLAIMPFRAFQHLIYVSDQLGCLNCVNKHLAPKGKLVFDVFFVDFARISNPRFSEETEDVPEFELADGRRLRRTHRMAGFHPNEQYNDVELIYYLTRPNGNTERIVHAFPMRYYFRYEIEHMLERCGFRVIDLYGRFDKSPLEYDSPEMIVVAEKHL